MLYKDRLFIIIIICQLDSPNSLFVNHTLQQDKYTGHYNFTLYWSIQRRDPLLLMIIRNFRISLLGNFPSSLRLVTKDISTSQHKASLASILMSLVSKIKRYACKCQ